MNFEKKYKQLMKEAAPAVAPTKPAVRPDTAPPGRPSTPGRMPTPPKHPLTPTRPNIHPRPKLIQHRQHSEDEERNTNPDVEKFLRRRRRNKV